MRLEDINEAMDTPGTAKQLAEEIGGRLIDGRMLLNQKDTALLLGITPRAFADWPIEPIKRVKNQRLYYWPDVYDLRDERRGIHHFKVKL